MSEKQRKSRAKRVVVLKFSNEDNAQTFRTCPEIYLRYNKDRIGIGLQALWNALAKGGFYENKKCTIHYQCTEQIKPAIWE